MLFLHISKWFILFGYIILSARMEEVGPLGGLVALGVLVILFFVWEYALEQKERMELAAIVAERERKEREIEKKKQKADSEKAVEDRDSSITFRKLNDEKVLLQASRDGDLELVKLIVADGTDPDTPNKHGVTPLMMAVHSGHVEIVRFLMAQRVDLNKRSEKGFTALKIARENGKEQIEELLKQAGAQE